MTRTRRCVAAARPSALLLTGCELRRLQAAAARRPRRRATTRSRSRRVRRRPRPGAAVTVKVNDVSVGKVDRHRAWTATTPWSRSSCATDVELPDNAVAEIRQTSLLGEKFVALSAPPTRTPARARWPTATRSRSSRAGRNPEVEEVLGALSLLLNGGGVAQLKTITQELNNALEGREGSARSVLEQIRTFMAQLDDNKADIVARDRVAQPPRRRCRAAAARSTRRSRSCPAPCARSTSQRDDLVKMLGALDQLSGVGVRVIKASKDATIDVAARSSTRCSPSSPTSGDDFVNASTCS